MANPKAKPSRLIKVRDLIAGMSVQLSHVIPTGLVHKRAYVVDVTPLDYGVSAVTCRLPNETIVSFHAASNFRFTVLLVNKSRKDLPKCRRVRLIKRKSLTLNSPAR